MALRRRFEILDFQLRNHIRSVALSWDQSRFLCTMIDEAWCFDIKGQPIWGLKLPGKEGWTRTNDESATSSEVQSALQLMNLTRPVSGEQLTQRYRELAMLWHPDRNQGDPVAHGRMTALNSAVEVLAAMDSPGETARARFVREQDHFEIDVGGERFTLDVGFAAGALFASDWIYAACFAARSNSVYLAGYSGRVVVLDPDGKPVSGYETGTPPNRIIDTGEYLYLLTDTRLYVIRGDSLETLIHIPVTRELIVTRNGFGLLESKRLRWFSKDGLPTATILSKEPIRRLYYSDGGLVVETRQRRAVFSGAAIWWD
jgi:hypothetical protein